MDSLFNGSLKVTFNKQNNDEKNNVVSFQYISNHLTTLRCRYDTICPKFSRSEQIKLLTEIIDKYCRNYESKRSGVIHTTLSNKIIDFDTNNKLNKGSVPIITLNVLMSLSSISFKE